MDFPDFKNLSSGPARGNAFDLKKLRPEDIQEFVMERKFEVVSVVLILVAILGGLQLYSQRAAMISEMDAKIKALQEKEGPIQGYKKALKEKEQFLSKLPLPLNEEAFLPQLTELAKRRNIRIVSFNPPQTKDDALYRKTVVQISCVAGSFREGLLFLNDVENSQYAMRIEAWSARQGASQRADSYGDRHASKNFMIDLTISSIEVLLNAQKK